MSSIERPHLWSAKSARGIALALHHARGDTLGVEMSLSRSDDRVASTRLTLKICAATLLMLFAAALCSAQEITIGVTYVCNGEHIYIEGCNIRDTSDTSTCMVAHPDHLTATGLNTYTSMTRGALKKLLPTCQQPTAKQVAAAKAFQKKQEDTYNADAQKATEQLNAATQPATYGQPQKPKTPEERAITRCVTSGRLPATCTGNSLLGAFSQMVGQVMPSLAKEPPPGPNMAGVFEGPGKWRLDFIDGGVLVNCAFLSPDQHSYKIEFKNESTVIVIDTTPKPLVLTLEADGTIVGPGPLTIDGVVASGYKSDGPDPGAMSGYTDKYGMSLSNQQAASTSELYSGGERYYGHVNSGGGHTTFASKTATCPAQNLSSNGASVGVQTMQTDLLKTMFGGDKGPPTPPGIRMHGIYAASTGFSVQFFPESAILGCGPDAARAYPYAVLAEGANAVIHVNAPDHPLTLAFKPDGSLDPGGTGPYQVHGRTVTGQNDDGDFTFAPMEQSCSLAVLTPSATIPASGGTATATNASAGNRAGAPDNGGGTLSTPDKPLGNAILTIVSKFPAQPGAANPLGGHPYVLLRNSYANVVAKAGVTVPAGMTSYKYVATICFNKTPKCQKVTDAIKADAASAVRADASGNGIFPGVPPGTYYLMISTRYNNQPLAWGQAVQLKAGPNSMALDPSNATPIN
jgi:hypothetical protein